MSPRMIAGKKIKAILYQLVPWVYLLKTASHLSATCAQESRAQPSVPSLLRRQSRQRRSDVGVVCVSVLDSGCEDGGASTLSRLPQQWGGMRRIKRGEGEGMPAGGKVCFSLFCARARRWAAVHAEWQMKLIATTTLTRPGSGAGLQEAPPPPSPCTASCCGNKNSMCWEKNGRGRVRVRRFGPEEIV